MTARQSGAGCIARTDRFVVDVEPFVTKG
jgi:hypothetical protein